MSCTAAAAAFLLEKPPRDACSSNKKRESWIYKTLFHHKASSAFAAQKERKKKKNVQQHVNLTNRKEAGPYLHHTNGWAALELRATQKFILLSSSSLLGIYSFVVVIEELTKH